MIIYKGGNEAHGFEYKYGISEKESTIRSASRNIFVMHDIDSIFDWERLFVLYIIEDKKSFSIIQRFIGFKIYINIVEWRAVLKFSNDVLASSRVSQWGCLFFHFQFRREAKSGLGVTLQFSRYFRIFVNFIEQDPMDPNQPFKFVLTIVEDFKDRRILKLFAVSCNC